MMVIEVSDDGSIDRTELTMQEIRDEIATQVAIELDTVWQQIKEMAIMICPKQTGALADSITLESEGGTGSISVMGGDFYQSSIYAGGPNVNPITGKMTAEYALFVHDGHAMPNGEFYEGVAFLADAVAQYEDELDACVDRAMNEMGINTQEMG